ncbi:GIY-YIG nuclease family protein [Vibrio parahaemolyticus]|nr:GIY-YIG nuclease family protein [Vibrio parahaemolyticus]
MTTSGIVYFLENESMPNLVKIGYTTCGINERLRQLNTTGVPSPFIPTAIFNVSDARATEAAIHDALKSRRVTNKREFFVGSTMELVVEVAETLGQYLNSTSLQNVDFKCHSSEPDKDDIYFMFYLLHDAYKSGVPMLTSELSQHHSQYSTMELELKLLNLEKGGWIARTNTVKSGLSAWQITPKGVAFMINGQHHDPALFE